MLSFNSLSIFKKLIISLLLIAVSVVPLFSIQSCSVHRKTSVNDTHPGTVIASSSNRITVQELVPIPQKSCNNIIIIHDYDLNGRTLVVDKDCVLKFKGGSIKNGHIAGNNSGIQNTSARYCFDRVSFSGTWNVKDITTDFFKDLNYEGSLNDVLSLANDEVKNNITIKDYGFDYIVVATTFDNYKGALHIPSYTDFKLDAIIRLKPTNLFQYRIIMMYNCHDIKIHGTGAVVGDKDKHDYSIDDAHIAWKSHQWGHGLKTAGCNNIEISGIEVGNCTGDSFSISDGSTNIRLDNVTAKDSRRQGVTIAVASDVSIKNSKFINIGRVNGTPPWSAIDIEPDDTDCELRNILISGCDIINCPNGIISHSEGYGNEYETTVNGVKVMKRDGRRYVNIRVTDCHFEKISNAFSLVGWEDVCIENCTVDHADYFMRAPLKNMKLRNNTGDCNHFTSESVVSNSVVKNNRIALKNEREYELKNSVLSNNEFTVNKGNIITRVIDKVKSK